MGRVDPFLIEHMMEGGPTYEWHRALTSWSYPVGYEEETEDNEEGEDDGSSV